jgi:Zn-dependent protease with chaperone function
VLAHEPAHIKSRDILLSSIAAVMVSVVTGIANALSLASLFGSSSGDSDEEGMIFAALGIPALYQHRGAEPVVGS